ncbi:hypothetical protein ACROYT_G017916 [Oculina patagonica]
MTSVERVITYAHIEQEPGHQCHHQPPNGWPEHGRVQVKNLGLVYYEGGPQILKDVSFTVDSHEKIGIVGRTGAGKSSLVSALFRMPQPTGHVIIDGVDISDINIQSSRRAMSVITQNPVLFNGSLRLNLDPFEEYEDKELWDALEEASLKSMVKKLPQQLGEDIKESGANFSVGERQLLCLARALLKKDKIIVMDEATANVDYKTDQLIQETIRTKFQHCTVMTIAHRLNTIIDYDRVLVLENGQIVEYDKPERLLQNKGGQFSILYHVMKRQLQLSAFAFTFFLFGWVDCASVPSCASMRSWFPGTPPASFADNLPYQLIVTGYVPKGENVPVFTPESSHTVYLNGSTTAEQKMRSFVGFIIYAENSVKNYTNGHFVTEGLPADVEVVNCSTLQGSVVLQTNPNVVYYEGFTAQLRYECPLRKCAACPGIKDLYKYDSYGCRTCECSCEFGCLAVYAPVCGTDGKTYGNECDMELEACICKRRMFQGRRDSECNVKPWVLSGGCDIVCLGIYDPVCGTDGKTYSNECYMISEACKKKKDISVSYKGECGSCEFGCLAVYAPVCGTDGKTYGNECDMELEACMQKKNVSVAHNGECGSECNVVCAGIYDPVCGTDGETYINECLMKLDACEKKKEVSVSFKGECRGRRHSECNVKPSVLSGRCDIVCTGDYNPVCGTDGETYSNECTMISEACEKKKDISVSYKGECGGAARLGFPGLYLMFAFLAFLWFSV